MPSVETINYTLALGTVALQVVSVALLVVFFFRNNATFTGNAAFIGRWGLWVGFFLTLASIALTLFYSDVLGFQPCPLCWYQRIFLYPQAILLGMAVFKRDIYIADYSIVLSVIGAAFALYQHALQMLGEGSLPCPASPEGVSCAQRIVFEFGYVTFPLMAFTLFAFLIVLMLFVRTRSNEIATAT